jgi:hypothetical protein
MIGQVKKNSATIRMFLVETNVRTTSRAFNLQFFDRFLIAFVGGNEEHDAFVGGNEEHDNEQKKITTRTVASSDLK